MKKLILLFSIVLGFALTGAFAQQPEFKFEKETHDFGKITLNKPVSYSFKFVNNGTQPLIIADVQSSCGCTVPKYTSTPIKKGETGTVTVTYDSKAIGSFNKVLTIRSNAKTPVKYLYIKGVVSE